MSVAILYLNEPFQIDVVENMMKMGVPITHWIHTGKPWFLKIVENNEAFKEIHFSSMENVFRRDLLLKEHPNEVILSSDIMESYKDVQLLYLNISDRLSYFPIPVRERNYFFKKVLKYWLNFFSKYDISTIIMEAAPCGGWDNVAYEVAKRKGIQTLFTYLTSIQDRILIDDDYKYFKKVPGDYLNNSNGNEIRKLLGEDIIDTFWNKISPTKMKSNVINKEMPVDGNKNIRPNIKMNMLSPRSLIDSIRVNLRKEQPSPFALNGYYRHYYHSFIKSKEVRKRKRLFEHYNSIASSFESEEKYIYSALHFQPERSTQPEGSWFEDQLLALEILSESIPEDYQLYVKEHPRQFSTSKRFGHVQTLVYKNEQFYEDILRMRNTKLIRMDVDSDQLVKYAKVVSTITGMVGWEGLLKDKPCIIFSKSWYAPCNSCYVVSSISECKSAVHEILNHSTPEAVNLDVMKFLHYYQDKFIVTTRRKSFALQSDLPYHELVNNLATAFKKRIDAWNLSE